MRKRSLHTRALAILMALLMAAPGLLLAAVPAPELPTPPNVGMSRQDQQKLGLKATGEVYKQMPVLPDSSPITQYVQQLGRKLQQVIPQQYSWPYQFHVVQQKEINAFALPGGPIFINVGTITAADNEAELAGVMAHEMSHVYMQHSAKQARQNVGPSIVAGLGQILGQMIGGVGGAIASMGGQITGGMWSMKYSRTDEAQADAVGAIIMYKAGYNPMYMAQFFQKLEKEGGSGGPQFLSDHPNPGNRVQAVSAEIKNWPARNYQNDSAQFVQAHQKAQTVKVYTAQQIAQMAKSGQIHNQVPAGVPVSGNTQAAPGGTMQDASLEQVMPSGEFQAYNGPGFSIQYPANWQVLPPSQGSSDVVIAPQAGVSQSGIAYGVLISVAGPQQGASLDQATQAVVNQIQQQNEGLRIIGTPQRITVNGQEGRSVDMMGNSPILGNNEQPLQEHDWFVDVPRSDGSLLYVIFISPDPHFSQLRPTFQKMLQSLRVQ
jgi:Zn-dependent protease with chaperone function